MPLQKLGRASHALRIIRNRTCGGLRECCPDPGRFWSPFHASFHPCRQIRPLSSSTRPAAPAFETNSPPLNPLLSKEDTPNDISNSTRRRDVSAWARLLDALLPHNVESIGAHAPDLVCDPGERLQVEEMLLILRSARDEAYVDLISYKGIQQGKWEEVRWIMNTMLEKGRGCHLKQDPYLEHLRYQWPSRGISLDEITNKPVATVEMPEPTRHTPRKPNPLSILNDDASARVAEKSCMGQIWLSLGFLILEAESKAKDAKLYESIMSHVLDLLAQMHHSNALPSTMYNYFAAKDESVVRRPPTLHLLSDRILTVLTDVAWKKHWVSEMAKAKDYGYELPAPRVQPELARVGSEVWLELVLWACVEGGWITEAASIIGKMEKQAIGSSQWSTISWEQVCKTRAPELDWTAILRLHIERTRLNQSTGIRVANSGFSSIDMGARTVSSEVILAILDGLVNESIARPPSGETEPSESYRHVLDCRNLLLRGDLQLTASEANSLALRTIETSILDLDLDVTMVGRIISLALLASHDKEPEALSTSAMDEDGIDYSASLLGLLHSTLFAYAAAGDLTGVKQSLEAIQNTIDKNRICYIQEFADEMRGRLAQGQGDLSSLAPTDKKAPPMLHPQVPVHVLESLLSFVADNKLAELGKWLLHNDDIDGGVFASQIYSAPALQAPLLRLASALADNNLMTRVLEHLDSPLSPTMLHALLRCQITLGKWQSVEKILTHFQKSQDEEADWESEDALSVAATVLRLSGIRRREQLMQAQTILLGLMEGRFDKARDPSQRRNLDKIMLSKQLGVVLRSIPGDGFAFLARAQRGWTLPFLKKAHLSASGFNLLLDEVVQRFGSAAGRDLWLKWCSSPGHEGEVFPGSASEEIIEPSLFLLRTIIRPILQKIRLQPSISSFGVYNQGDQESEVKTLNGSILDPVLTKELSGEENEVLKWAIKVFQAFALDDRAIRREIYSKAR